jgi:hypothetical protein
MEYSDYVYGEEDLIYDNHVSRVYYAAKVGEINKNYVAKVVFIYDDDDTFYDNFYMECKLALLASDHGYGPEVFDMYVEDYPKTQKPIYGIIIMERFGEPVQDPIDLPEEREEVASLLHRMHEDRIVHTDLYRRNLLQKFDYKLQRKTFRIIDFGLAFFLKDPLDDLCRAIDWVSLCFGFWNPTKKDFDQRIEPALQFRDMAHISKIDWNTAYRWRVTTSARSLKATDVADCHDMYLYLLPKLSPVMFEKLSSDAMLDRMAFLEWCVEKSHTLETEIKKRFSSS